MDIELTTAISLIELYHTQYAQTDALWGYFGTVTLAILAFTIGADRATKSFREAGTIVGGYLLFCTGNFSALSKAQLQLREFAKHAMEAAQSARIPLTELEPFSVENLSIFYWIVVSVVCIGILIITWLRRKENAA